MRTNELQRQFEKYIQTVQESSNEIQAAQTIQQMLLSDDVPICKDLSCIGISIPAYQLSGDYYDFIYDEQHNRYWIFIGDVMGKGIPASLIMVMLRSTVRVLTHCSGTPSKLVSNLNNFLFKDMTRLRSFSTLFCGMFDLNSGDFLYTSAGHPNPILIKDMGSAIRLEGKGTIIGIVKDRQYQDYSVSLSDGDLLVLCTDGILEAMNENKNQYGIERFQNVIEACKGCDLSDLIQHITHDVKRFSENYRRDDVTIVAARYEKKKVT